MDTDAIVTHLTRSYEGASLAEDSGNYFFSYSPDPEVRLDGWLPFATLVVNDLYDQVSRLDRTSVFRLNIGVSPATYRKLSGSHPAASPEAGAVDTGHDFTALDRLMPHPEYAQMSWVCVLNPSEETFKTVQPLLEEAYRLAVRRYEARVKRKRA